SSIPLTSRIATAASCCLQPCSGCILSCRHCLLTPAIKGANSTTRSKKSCLTCEPRSSSARIRPRDSWCCPSAGSLSARWRGSTAAADSPRIGRNSIAQRSRFCALPQSGSCSENFVILTNVFGQTLKDVDLHLPKDKRKLCLDWAADELTRQITRRRQRFH